MAQMLRLSAVHATPKTMQQRRASENRRASNVLKILFCNGFIQHQALRQRGCQRVEYMCVGVYGGVCVSVCVWSLCECVCICAVLCCIKLHYCAESRNKQQEDTGGPTPAPASASAPSVAPAIYQSCCPCLGSLCACLLCILMPPLTWYRLF